MGLRNFELGWIGGKAQVVCPSDEGQALYAMCRRVIEDAWHQEPVWQVQLTALDPQPSHMQMDLFVQPDPHRMTVNRAIDTINDRYGEFTIAPARLLKRSSMPNVISPAWKPDGHRQTI